MALISAANALTIFDKLGAIYDLLNTPIGTKLAGAVAGNAQNLLAGIMTLLTGTVNDFQTQVDLEPAINGAQKSFYLENVLSLGLTPVLGALITDFQGQGSGVAASIVDIDSFLKYYNGGVGGVLFANMVTPSFNLFYQAVRGAYLTSGNYTGAPPQPTLVGSVMSPAINPANGQASGMGTCTFASAYVAGAAVVQNAVPGQLSYSEVPLIALVTTTFSGGSAAPIVTVTGVDHLGNTGQTWTGTFAGNNPTATIAQQTVSSGAISAQARATVTVGATAGIVPGSWVTINKGLADQEIVLAEAVPSGTTFTAVFLKAHLASATVDCNTSLVLVNGSARRCRSVTNIAITGAGGWGAGNIRVEGVQTRVGV